MLYTELSTANLNALAPEDETFYKRKAYYSLQTCIARLRSISSEKVDFSAKQSNYGSNTTFSLDPYINQLRSIADEYLGKRNLLFGEEPNKNLNPNYPEYEGLGQEAVIKVLTERKGQVKGAFFRYDIGKIDVVWGKVFDHKKHTGYGLVHIIDKHGEKIVRQIGEIIKGGNVHPASNGKIKIVYKKLVLILKQEWDGVINRNCIVSCFDKKKKRIQ